MRDHRLTLARAPGLVPKLDNFAITLATPIDPVAPGALLDMGIGISFGYQGTTQYTIVDIKPPYLA